MALWHHVPCPQLNFFVKFLVKFFLIEMVQEELFLQSYVFKFH